MFKIIIFVAALAAFSTARPSVSINPNLHKTLESGVKANIFLTLSASPSPILRSLQKLSFYSREERLNSVTGSLQSHAASTQKPILSFLSKVPGLRYQSFWISNQIFIKDADLSLVEKLINLNGISDISEEVILPLEKLPAQSITRRDPSHLAEAGVEKIQAPLVWEMEGGSRGEGIRVAEMTTGVRGTHEALRNNFVGDYGWFDPATSTDVPNDLSGIGTFSTGLLVGSGGIGVAPGAKWMACRGCGEFACSQTDLLTCGQFMACPTLPNGGNPNCTRAPHVVVNNWGGGGSVWYDHIVEAWHAGDITPVFVAGMSGPSCGTAFAADNVVAVGAVNLNDTLSPGSSRGPSPQGKIMPHIVAPGVGIRSAWNTDDSAYNSISSTTPASGLVAGTIALLKGISPTLSYDEVTKALYFGADTVDLIPTGGDCGGISETTFPNNAYGYGRLNAYKSAMSLQTKP